MLIFLCYKLWKLPKGKLLNSSIQNLEGFSVGEGIKHTIEIRSLMYWSVFWKIIGTSLGKQILYYLAPNKPEDSNSVGILY